MTPSIPTAADIAAVVYPPDMLQPTTYVMCGGCGEIDPDKRCLGCLHDFEAEHGICAQESEG